MAATWEECQAAGMSAQEAANAMGKSSASAYKWAIKTGKKWKAVDPAEKARRMREGIARSAGRAPKSRFNGMGEKRNDARALPPDQERTGGRFWATNNKTGETFRASSTTRIYRIVMLQGWVDWDWGEGE